MRFKRNTKAQADDKNELLLINRQIGKKMRIKPGAVIQSTLVSILVFILIDAGIEYVSARTSGITFLTYFEKMLDTRFSTRFYMVNFLLFSGQMLAVMILYGSIRSMCPSLVKPVLISTCFPLCLALLILLQMVNLGLYPLKPAVLLSISMLTGFPGGVIFGAFAYERISYS